MRFARIIHGFCLLLILAGGLGACSRNNPVFLEPPFENRLHDRFPGKELQFKPPYRLGQADALTIEVYRYDEFNGTVKVANEGFIRLPFTKDKVYVLDMTLDEVETAIAKALAPYLVREPKVTATLVRPDSNFYYVLGAVGRGNGKYPLGDEYLFVREAVIRAGWPTEDAGLKRTQLASSKPDKNQLRKINLKKILYEGDLRENYQLEPGDVVYIPHTRISQLIWYMSHFLRPFGVMGQYSHGGQAVIDYTQDEEEFENIFDEFIKDRRDINNNARTNSRLRDFRRF